MFEGKVECKRCHQIWTLPQASPGIECNCHTWCQKGTKPSDCSMTDYRPNINWKYPNGSDQNPKQENNDIAHLRYYCSVHEVYSKKTKIWLEVDWKRWYAKRAPEKFRMLQR